MAASLTASRVQDILIAEFEPTAREIRSKCMAVDPITKYCQDLASVLEGRDDLLPVEGQNVFCCYGHEGGYPISMVAFRKTGHGASCERFEWPIGYPIEKAMFELNGH